MRSDMIRGLVIISILCGLVWAGYSHGVSTTEASKDLEIAKIRAEYSQRENAALKEVIALKDKAISDERAAKAAMDAKDELHRKELKNEKDASDRVIAGLRAGAVRLSFKPVQPVPAARSGGRPAPESASCGSDGRSEVELPPAIAADIYSLAADADTLAINYRRLQEVVRGYMSVCGPAENAPKASQPPDVH